MARTVSTVDFVGSESSGDIYEVIRFVFGTFGATVPFSVIEGRIKEDCSAWDDAVGQLRDGLREARVLADRKWR
jgi:hypothetical protein